MPRAGGSGVTLAAAAILAGFLAWAGARGLEDGSGAARGAHAARSPVEAPRGASIEPPIAGARVEAALLEAALVEAPPAGSARRSREPVPSAQAEEPPGARLEVRVRVAEHFGPSALAVPGVSVVAGVSLEPSEPPGGPARAAAALERARSDVRELARGRADADGRVVLSLDVPAAWRTPAEGRVASVWAEVRSPGFQTLRRAVRLPTDAGAIDLAVQARRGATLRGRVLAQDRAPAAGVVLHRLPVRGGEPDARSSGTARTGADGAFELHATALGPAALLALGGARGSAFLPAVDLDSDAGPLELVLAGAGALAGVVVDPLGAPARGQRVAARPADLGSARVTLEDRLRRVRGDGVIDGDAATGADGRFRITGLAPGWYHLWALAPDGADAERRLTRAPVATGAADLRLVVDRHAVIVRVLDEAGAAVEPVVQRPDDVRLGDGPALWCAAARPSALGSSSRGVPAWSEPDGTVILEVTPEQPYLLGLASAGRPLVERTFTIAPGEHARAIELHLPAADAPATLELVVRAPDGSRFTERCNVVVRSRETGARVHGGGGELEDGRWSAALPSGAFRVTVDARPAVGQHGWIKPTPFAPCELDVELAPGERVALDAVLGASGRLALRATLPDGAGLSCDGCAADDATSHRLHHVRGADVRLDPAAGGEPILPLFQIERRSPPFLSCWGPRAPAGERVVSLEPIPPGRYVLRLDAAGCAPLEREIEILAGEVAEVDARLERR